MHDLNFDMLSDFVEMKKDVIKPRRLGRLYRAASTEQIQVKSQRMYPKQIGER